MSFVADLGRDLVLTALIQQKQTEVGLLNQILMQLMSSAPKLTNQVSPYFPGNTALSGSGLDNFTQNSLFPTLNQEILSSDPASAFSQQVQDKFVASSQMEKEIQIQIEVDNALIVAAQTERDSVDKMIKQDVKDFGLMGGNSGG